VLTLTFEGQPEIRGFWVSWTVTVNWQLSVPQEFVANALTVVVPTEKRVPGFLEYVIVGAGLPVAVAANVTTAPHWFGSLL
jgi:hypothetical protein